MKRLSDLVNPLQHCEAAALRIINLLHVPVTKTSLQKQLVDHPDYPSLLSISDVLKNYGIENIAARLDVAEFASLPIPFLAHVQDEKTREDFFAVVQQINQNGLEFYNSSSATVTTISMDAFKKMYKGTVLLVEAGEQTGEKEYNKNLIEEKRDNTFNTIAAFLLPVVTVLACIFALINYSIAVAIAPVIYTVLCLAGVILGALLVWYEIDEYNPAVRQICQAGKKVNCSAVLNSQASKIFGMSWGSVGAIYFLALLLSLLVNSIVNGPVLLVAGCISLLALPYTIFSVYYQWRIVKQWCLLCLGVQAILLLQFVTAIAGHFYDFTLPPAQIAAGLLPVVASFAFLFVLSVLLMPALKKAKSAKNKTTELQRLKHNPQIFDALLAKQKIIEVSADGLGITIGAANPKYKIVKVCNPYCGPCAKAHPEIDELLESNDAIQVQIIFTATEDEKDYRNKPVAHLLAIQENDGSKIKQALDDWYLPEKKDYDVFAAKYADTPILEGQKEAIKAMHAWCDATNIAFTPTFFVNGYQLPDIYTVADLKYFLAE